MGTNSSEEQQPYPPFKKFTERNKVLLQFVSCLLSKLQGRFGKNLIVRLTLPTSMMRKSKKIPKRICELEPKASGKPG
jgi:hypothetical protein